MPDPSSRRVRRPVDGDGGPAPSDAGSPAEPLCFATLAVLDDYVLIPVHRRRADMFRPELSDAELASWIHEGGAGRNQSGPG